MAIDLVTLNNESSSGVEGQKSSNQGPGRAVSRGNVGKRCQLTFCSPGDSSSPSSLHEFCSVHHHIIPCLSPPTGTLVITLSQSGLIAVAMEGLGIPWHPGALAPSVLPLPATTLLPWAHLSTPPSLPHGKWHLGTLRCSQPSISTTSSSTPLYPLSISLLSLSHLPIPTAPPKQISPLC